MSTKDLPGTHIMSRGKDEPMTTPRTINTQEPGKYHAQKTVGGWVVVFVNEDRSIRNVDGGKLHKNRQNAYVKAKYLNDAIPADHNNWYYVDQKDGSCGQYVLTDNKVDAIRQVAQSYGMRKKGFRARECNPPEENQEYP